MTPATLTAPAAYAVPWSLEMLRWLYPPAVPGGIALRFTRRRGRNRREVEAEQCPSVRTPGQAMRAMRRVTLAYGVMMTPRSRAAAHRWNDDMEELCAALAALSNRRPYRRSWMLRNGDVITVAVIPATAATTQRAYPAAEFTPQYGEAPR
ncbi:hypothetical protein ACIG5E_34300 [Kitasatospora sp. NPDC053057]|uniref:hypothetical protein n=1 Tax=Kitasatospora sp. NPDC053057 TaxID=3364062 RepID=UPI0037CAE7E1